VSGENSNNNAKKKVYVFGEIKEYDLEKIEQEVLKESVYLDVFAGSDLAFKENCKILDPADVSNKLKALNAYSFNYKTNEFPDYQFENGGQIGFMAQEIEAVFPDLVKKDKNGNRFVNYTQAIPLMLQAINHLSSNLEKLEKRVNELSKN
jgi:hypothetical protein